MASKRMTANPIKPSRYRPGKGQDESSSGSEESDDQASNAVSALPPPKASSFPSESTRIASSLRDVDLDGRRAKAAAEEDARQAAEKKARELQEAGFETEESNDDTGSDEAEDDDDGSEESSSDDDDATSKPFLRPTFITKAQRANLSSASHLTATTAISSSNSTTAITASSVSALDDEQHRRAKANAIVQAQLEKNAAARAASKKHWDDDEDHAVAAAAADDAAYSSVSDTDGRDPAAERAAWKLRELRRIARARHAIEHAEAERAAIDARRALPAAERDALDRAHVDGQRAARAERASMGYLQKYYHRGAFFRDEARAAGLEERDVVGVRVQDEVAHRELLPEYMQIRDMTRLGRKGRTRYKDLKTEDTGRWGGYADEARRGGGFLGGAERGGDRGADERFAPDGPTSRGASGANATVVRERPVGRQERSSRDARKRSTSPAEDRVEREDKRRKVDV